MSDGDCQNQYKCDYIEVIHQKQMDEKEMPHFKKFSIFKPPPISSNPPIFQQIPFHISFSDDNKSFLLIDHESQTIIRKNSHSQQANEPRRNSSNNKNEQPIHSNRHNRKSLSIFRQQSFSLHHKTNIFPPNRKNQVEKEKMRKHKIFELEHNLQVEEAKQSRMNEQLKQILGNHQSKVTELSELDIGQDFSNRQDKTFISKSIPSIDRLAYCQNNSQIQRYRTTHQNVSNQLMTPEELSCLLQKLKNENKKNKLREKQKPEKVLLESRKVMQSVNLDENELSRERKQICLGNKHLVYKI